MSDEPLPAPYVVNQSGELLVNADLLLTTPELTGRGLQSLPFIYVPSNGNRGPLWAYVEVAEAVRWLERLGSAGCPSCGPDGNGALGLLDQLRERYRRHQAGEHLPPG
jgi:hypothetical protein